MGKRATISMIADLLVVVFIGVYISNIVSTRLSRKDTNNGPRQGASVGDFGIDWAKRSQNLVFILNRDCHLCTKSAPFYRHLTGGSGAGNTQFIALFPHTADLGREYLRTLGVNVDTVRGPVTLPENWFRTPTVLIVDNQGRIRKAWIGVLAPDLEQEVLAELR